MLLSTFTGNLSITGAAATIVAKFMTNDTTLEGSPFHFVERDPRSNVKKISQNTFQAGTGHVERGLWNENVYDIPEKSIVEIWVKKKDSRYNPGFSYDEARIVIRMRESAALRRIRIPLPDLPSSRTTAGYFEGRFDIVTPDLIDSLGLSEALKAPHYHHKKHQDKIFEIKILEDELAPVAPVKKEVITTREGKEITVTKQRAGRIIRLRK